MSSDEIPLLGLGTYRISDYEQCAETVGTALEVGYRCIDTAEAYQNEEAVAAAIEAATGVSRDDVYLMTKVLHPRFAQGYTTEDVVDAAYRCLDRLSVDRVEIMFGVHWPGGEYDPQATFEACERLYDDGVMDRLGVCNMTTTLLDEVRATSSVPITVLQVELHPLLQQKELRAYCDTHGISLIGYAPFGNGRIFEVPELQDIADKHGVSVAQVTLAWFRAKGIPTIPKATGRTHIIDNWESQTLNLDKEDIDKIDGISTEERQYNPDYAPEW